MDMRGRLLTGFLIIMLSAAAATAALNTVPLPGDRTALDLVDARSDALQFRVSIGELQTMNVATKAGDFTRLSVPGFHTTMVDGSPELPMMNRLIEVPFGASARVEIVSSSSRIVKLADFGIDTPLFPHQPSLSKSQDPATVPFVYDRGAYEMASVKQEMIRVNVLGQMRSRTIARCEISPGGIPASDG